MKDLSEIRRYILKYGKPTTILLAYLLAWLFDWKETLVFTGVILFADFYYNVHFIPRRRRGVYKKLKEAEVAVALLKKDVESV